jgi:hypothetical protein
MLELWTYLGSVDMPMFMLLHAALFHDRDAVSGVHALRACLSRM